MSKIAVITGGTSGIGLATAKELLAHDCRVYELSRRESGAAEGVTHIRADVTREDEVRAAVAEVMFYQMRLF